MSVGRVSAEWLTECHNILDLFNEHTTTESVKKTPEGDIVWDTILEQCEEIENNFHENLFEVPPVAKDHILSRIDRLRHRISRVFISYSCPETKTE